MDGRQQGCRNDQDRLTQILTHALGGLALVDIGGDCHAARRDEGCEPFNPLDDRPPAVFVV
jgi:hypothetical protein